MAKSVVELKKKQQQQHQQQQIATLTNYTSKSLINLTPQLNKSLVTTHGN